MEWLANLWNSAAALAVLGGLVAAVRVAANSPRVSLRSKLWNVAAAVMLSVGLAEYLTSSEVPRLSLVIGLVSGSVADSLLDALRALSPKMAGGVVDVVLGKFGYARKVRLPENDERGNDENQ